MGENSMLKCKILRGKGNNLSQFVNDNAASEFAASASQPRDNLLKTNRNFFSLFGFDQPI
jgi:hypothetical protein